MRVTLTGATGLIGGRLVRALVERGDEVAVLSRARARARTRLGVEAERWDPVAGPAPAEALAGRDGVVHLAGEPVAQRWSEDAKRRIRESRTLGTASLVAGLRAADPRPGVLVSASAVGYYGPHGDEQVDESTPPGTDFLADVCVAWEAAARAAEPLGVRVARVRTGVVLDPDGGALEKMLPPFKAGVGGPVAGGRQWMPWIHVNDLVGIYLAALDGGADWAGPINATAPAPATNRDFSKALGRALHRPALAPVPRLAMKLLYGDMEQIVTTGQRAVPTRALELGYGFRHPELDEALRAAL
jgi:uncharacterized protein (TIGR01777 family)